MSPRKKVYDNAAVEKAWATYNEVVRKAAHDYDLVVALARDQLNKSLEAAYIKQPRSKKP